jgi:hypothetical protein
LALPLLLGACADPPAQEDVRFVRGGLVRNGAFEAKVWAPGDNVAGVVAPVQPECVPMFQVELEDMSRLAAMGAPDPGAALAFSPDGAWLAIGSDAGSLRVVDAHTGALRAERPIAEGAVKQVAWGADVLYVGVQSPDAELLAVDPATLATRWSARLADELETSALPPKDDVYGLYSLPAVFSIRPLEGGDILVAGSHGWVAEGVRKNRARLYRYGADGTLRGAWPPAGPADAVLLHPAVFGGRALVGVSRSADGPPPTDLPVDGVAAIDLATMTTAWEHRFEVLAPHFTSVYMWEAVGISETLGFAGMGDGRAFLFGPDGALTHTLTPGVPVLAQGVPIATGVGFGTVFGDTAYFLTTSTNIPWGSADPMTRPPAAHPAQNTLHAVGPDGATRWAWQGDHAVQGLAVSPGGEQIVVTAGARETDTRRDLYGALVFHRETGALVTRCATEGPAYFRPTWAADGRIAVSEAPFSEDGAVKGRYRVTVFR